MLASDNNVLLFISVGLILTQRHFFIIDSPLIVMEAKVSAAVEVSAVFVKIGVSGGLTCRVGEFQVLEQIVDFFLVC